MDSVLHEVMDALSSNKYASAGAMIAAALAAGLLLNFVFLRVAYKIARKTETDLDDKIIRALRKPTLYTAVIIGLVYAARKITSSASSLYLLDGLLATLAVLIWASAGIKISAAILEVLAARTGQSKIVQKRTLPLFKMMTKITVIGGAAYGLLLAWDVDVTAWLASAGILGIAIGFAAKDTLANFFSGIFILADAPYKIGDYVVLASGERGRVTDIGIRTTRLLTRDDIEIIVPNATIANAKIVNESGGRPLDEKRRVRVDVAVEYGSDIEHVRRVLTKIMHECEYLEPDPEPRVRFRELGDWALKFQVMGWIREPALKGRAVDDLLTRIYNRFREEGINIPYPKRDVHLRQDASHSGEHPARETLKG